MTSFSIFNSIEEKTILLKLSYILKTFENNMEMEHLLQKSKCFIFHNIFRIHDISKASKGVIME